MRFILPSVATLATVAALSISFLAVSAVLQPRPYNGALVCYSGEQAPALCRYLLRLK